MRVNQWLSKFGQTNINPLLPQGAEGVIEGGTAIKLYQCQIKLTFVTQKQLMQLSIHRRLQHRGTQVESAMRLLTHAGFSG